jgi:hypothetical protein
MTEFAEAILSVGWFLLILILGVLGVCSVAVIARPLPRASTASRTRRARPTRMRVLLERNILNRTRASSIGFVELENAHHGKQTHVLVGTGASGAGKTSAVRAFEARFFRRSLLLLDSIVCQRPMAAPSQS